MFDVYETKLFHECSEVDWWWTALSRVIELIRCACPVIRHATWQRGGKRKNARTREEDGSAQLFAA